MCEAQCSDCTLLSSKHLFSNVEDLKDHQSLVNEATEAPSFRKHLLNLHWAPDEVLKVKVKDAAEPLTSVSDTKQEARDTASPRRFDPKPQSLPSYSALRGGRQLPGLPPSPMHLSL